MSRVIKFRVMDTDGKWHYFTLGDFVCHATIPAQLNPETWAQFTGLTDKNGVEIYEGDIVCVEYKWMDHIKKGKPYPVEFSDCDASVQGSVCDVPIIAFNFGGSPLTTDENYEVIGNIYQNPELLQVN